MKAILLSCVAFAIPALLSFSAFAGNGGVPTVPEPGSLALLGVGAAAIAVWRLRRRK